MNNAGYPSFHTGLGAENIVNKPDDGWDECRARVFERQLAMGIIPEGTELTERDSTMAVWDNIPEYESALQAEVTPRTASKSQDFGESSIERWFSREECNEGSETTRYGICQLEEELNV